MDDKDKSGYFVVFGGCAFLVVLFYFVSAASIRSHECRLEGMKHSVPAAEIVAICGGGGQ